MGANAIFNLLRRTHVLLMAEGVDAFKVDVPPKLASRMLRDTEIRRATGCSVIGLETEQGLLVNPPPDAALPAGAKLILIGSAEAEDKFLDQYVRK